MLVKITEMFKYFTTYLHISLFHEKLNEITLLNSFDDIIRQKKTLNNC